MKKTDEETEGKKGFTEKQKAELKKYTVFGLLFMLFLGVIWFIFRPTDAEKEENTKGFGLNTEIPAPEKTELTDNKKNAYEQEYMKQRQSEKKKVLNNFALLTLGNKDTISKQSGDISEEKKANIKEVQRYDNASLGSVRNSVDSYKKTNQAISSFYSSPKETEEVKKLKEEIENLKAELKDRSETVNRLQEQTELMERSYKLASKYFPQRQDENSFSTRKEPGQIKVAPVGQEKNSAVAVRELGDNVVSALPQNISNEEFIETYSQERNIGFYSSADSETSIKNTIQACIDRDQVIVEGQDVSLRLLVPVQVGNLVLPINSLTTGKSSIQGERLYVNISSIEYEGMIMSVDLKAYDLDGQIGLSVRDMMEVNAAKEIAGNMGGDLGTSISLTQNAGQQIAGDLSKSLIQGVSQYVQKKVRTPKVNLKAGYRLLLVTGKN